MPTAPADLPRALDDVDALEAALGRRVAVFLDYDGTLAPIVEDPDAAVMPDRTRAAVARLAAMVPLAMVSGRDAEDVRSKVDLPGVVYAGSHGLDLRDDAGADIGDGSADRFLDAIDAAEASLREAVGDLDGVTVERKRFAIAVHHRRAPQSADAVRAACEDVAAADDRLRTSGGKEIVEVRPDVDMDKGTAVLGLLERVTGDDGERVALYVGDDVTDEDAFAVLSDGRGVGVLVRDDERRDASRADWAVDGTDEVAALLERLADHLGGPLADDPWVLAYDHADPAREDVREALSTVGNGVICTRGAAAEAVADGDHYKGTYRAGLYNRAVTRIAGRDIENEDLVNLPDWTLIRLHVDGDPIALDGPDVTAYRQELDLRTGVLTRRSTVDVGAARRLTVTQSRFISMADPHLCVQTTQVTVSGGPVELEVEASLDGTVVNAGVARYAELTGEHLEHVTAAAGHEESEVLVRTRQSEIDVAVVARTLITVDGAPVERAAEAGHRIATHRATLRLAPGQRLDVERLAALVTERDVAVADPLTTARDTVHRSTDLAAARAAHDRVWASRWPAHRLDVGGLEGRDALAVNLHAYHLMTTMSHHTVPLDVGIPARGWHGEAYRGHIFWDELYIVPVLAHTEPWLARAGLRYRICRLSAARANACDEGFAGAMFPWQAGSDGREESQRLHLNPVSGEWVPDGSRRQRHIGASIAWECWRLWRVTQAAPWLTEEGAELIVEIARFWASIARLGDDGRYHIPGVMGPDEFHEAYPDHDEPGLDDNAYTNVMAAWVLARADEALDAMPAARREQLAVRIDLTDADRRRWREVREGLHVPVRDGVIEQFAGYLDLDELDWDAYRRRYGDIRRLDRILDAEGDSPDHYQLSKQADTLLMWYVLDPDEVQTVLASLGAGDVDVDATVDHHLARTSHGSTLSKMVHAWVLAVLGRDDSFAFFRDALASDIADVQNGTTGEGVHLGVMAGTLDLLRRCYAGVDVDAGVVRVRPHMPVELSHVTQVVRLPDGRDVTVHVTHDSVTFTAPPDGPAVPVRLGATPSVELDVPAGTTHEVALPT